LREARSNRGARLEGGGLPPNVEEHVAKQIFGKRLIIDEAQQPSIDGDTVTREQRPHRQSITCGDSLDQLLVRKGFPERRLSARGGSHIKTGCRHGYPLYSRPAQERERYVDVPGFFKRMFHYCAVAI